jgi:hypothetical protein
MTAQQDQWVSLIEDRLWKIQDTGVRPDALSLCQELLAGMEKLRTLLNERA